MKVVADKLQNAGNVLEELLEFMQTSVKIRNACLPYKESKKDKPLPRYIVETSTQLRTLLVKNFERQFPHICSVVINGGGRRESNGRVYDALYKFNLAQQKINEAHCVIPSDDRRSEVVDYLNSTIGDVIIWIMIQYNLVDSDCDEITMSVEAYCNRNKITPDVFLGELRQILWETGKTWYAWEVASPYYAALNEMDAQFVAECEDTFAPLTEDIAKQILDGSLDIMIARGMLLDARGGSSEDETDDGGEELTLSSLITQMKLI